MGEKEKEMPNYYAIIPASIRYDNNLKANEKLLYGEITALCGKDWYCWASNNYFAELYNVDKMTISRRINNLKKYWHICILLKTNNKKEIIKRNIYINNNVNTPIDKKIYTYRQKNLYPIDEKVKGNIIKDNNINNNINKISKGSIYNVMYENENDDTPSFEFFEKNLENIDLNDNQQELKKIEEEKKQTQTNETVDYDKTLRFAEMRNAELQGNNFIKKRNENFPNKRQLALNTELKKMISSFLKYSSIVEFDIWIKNFKAIFEDKNYIKRPKDKAFYKIETWNFQKFFFHLGEFQDYTTILKKFCGKIYYPTNNPNAEERKKENNLHKKNLEHQQTKQQSTSGRRDYLNL